MADISGLLVKNSYDYVLQCDFFTGIIYRIGGTAPINPIFQEGLIVNSAFTYINGSPQPGYVLLTDGTGYAYWGPMSSATPSSGVTSITVGSGLSANSSTGAVTIIFTGTTGISGDYLPLSGGTVTGATIFTNGLTANTISATTYLNYPDSYVTGFSINLNTITLTQNRNDSFSSFTVNLTGLTASTSVVQGITGITATNGLSSNTVNNQTTIINTDPDQIVTITGGTNIQVISNYPNFGINFTGTTGISGDYLPLSGGTVTGATNFTAGLTANTISATTYQNLPLSALTYTTGGTYTNSTSTLSLFDSSGNTIIITGFTKYFISGSSPTDIVNYGDRWYNTNNGIELVYINDGNSDQWVQPANTPGPPGYSNLLITTGVTTSALTLDINTNYYGVSYSGTVDLALPNPSGNDGYSIHVKDESGNAGIYRIRINSVFGLIDGNTYVDMNSNYMSLHFVARNNNWWII